MQNSSAPRALRVAEAAATVAALAAFVAVVHYSSVERAVRTTLGAVREQISMRAATELSTEETLQNRTEPASLRAILGAEHFPVQSHTASGADDGRARAVATLRLSFNEMSRLFALLAARSAELLSLAIEVREGATAGEKPLQVRLESLR